MAFTAVLCWRSSCLISSKHAEKEKRGFKSGFKRVQMGPNGLKWVQLGSNNYLRCISIRRLCDFVCHEPNRWGFCQTTSRGFPSLSSKPFCCFYVKMHKHWKMEKNYVKSINDILIKFSQGTKIAPSTQCGNYMISLSPKILREINFRNSRSTNSAILTH